jgi:hypothetical protein
LIEERTMKKGSIFFSVLFLSVVTLSPAWAKHEKTIEGRNEYGGKTEETTYSKGDDHYDEGISKIIEYYDGTLRIKKIVSFYLIEHSNKDGVYKREQYYHNDPFEEARLKRAEFYYTDAHAETDGIREVEIEYDSDGKKKKAEYYYTDAYARKKVLAKMEVFYNSRGEAYKRVYLDKDGKIISQE